MLAEDIDVFAGDVEHLLLLAQPLDGPKLIAVAGGALVPLLIRCALHTLVQASLELGGLAPEQELDVGDRLVILPHAAQSPDARTQAALDGILEAGALHLAVNLHRAGAKLEISVGQVQRLGSQRKREKRG